MGGLSARGVSPELVVLSDDAPQFVILVDAACWIDAEWPLAKLGPHNEEHQADIEQVRTQIWGLYQNLKANQEQPQETRCPELEPRFDTLMGQRTGYPRINGIPSACGHCPEGLDRARLQEGG